MSMCQHDFILERKYSLQAHLGISNPNIMALYADWGKEDTSFAKHKL